MPRRSDGVFELATPPVVSGTTIQASWANTTLQDIATGLTESLDRFGRNGILGQLLLGNGSSSQPTLSWTAEQNTGFYRFGAGDMRLSIQATDLFRWTPSGAFVSDGAGGWKQVLVEGAADAMPPGSTNYQTLTWNNGTGEWVPSSDLLINYNTGAITIAGDLNTNTLTSTGPAALNSLGVTGNVTVGGISSLGPVNSANLAVTGNITVTGTVDGVDVGGLNTSVNNHINQNNIHFADAPNTPGVQYARFEGGWAEVAPSGEVIPGATVDGSTIAWDTSTGGYIVKTTLKLLDTGAAEITGPLQFGSATTRIDQSTGSMRFFTNNTQNATLTSTGRLGIKTATPQGELDVNGSIYTEGQALLSTTLAARTFKRFEVRDTLPGTPDESTLYFLTTAS